MNETKTPQTPALDALAAIRSQKADVRKRMRKSAAYIKNTTHQLFTPPKATTKLESFMNLLDQGVAIYDGVMLGMRVMRNIKHIFGRK